MTTADNIPGTGTPRGIPLPRLIAAIAILFVGIGLVQTRLDQRRGLFNPVVNDPKRGLSASIRNNVFGASMLGIREVAAGMLWVKADELFHNGQYTELIPYFKLVTFLDPHQIDVYSTGAWHLSYNLGDARLVPQSTAFLDEGIANNSKIWDLYFQKGWLLFDWPAEDYEAALPLFQEAAKHPSTDGSPAPPYITHMIAHAMVRQGRVDDAIAQWQTNIDYAEAEHAKAKKTKNDTDIRYWQQERDVCRNNRELLLIRKTAREDVAKNPKRVTFTADVQKRGSRLLEVRVRTQGFPPLTDSYGEESNGRLELILQDRDYDKLAAQHKNDLLWVTKNLTRFRSIYNIIERNGTVTDRSKPVILVEMNKDPADQGRNPMDIYPLTSDEYELILRFQPRVRRQPEAVQNAFGWIGEGLAPGGQTRTGPSGSQMVEKRIPLKLDDIL